MIILCPDCEADPSLGAPSHARWKGPNGQVYCSLHLINRFGHGERLVPIEDYEPPAKTKPPLPKEEPPPRQRREREVKA